MSLQAIIISFVRARNDFLLSAPMGNNYCVFRARNDFFFFFFYLPATLVWLIGLSSWPRARATHWDLGGDAGVTGLLQPVLSLDLWPVRFLCLTFNLWSFFVLCLGYLLCPGCVSTQPGHPGPWFPASVTQGGVLVYFLLLPCGIKWKYQLR